MAVQPTVFSQSTAIAATDTTYVAADLAKRMIDKCTIYNSDTVARTVTINLVVSAGSAAAANVIMVKTLLAGETYTCPEIVGHYLNGGDFLSAKASTAAVVNLRVSGRQVS